MVRSSMLRRTGRRPARFLTLAPRQTWVLVVVLSLIVAACGTTPAESDDADTTTTAQETTETTTAETEEPGTTATPEAGGDLRVVVTVEPRSMNYNMDNNRSSVGIALLMIENLVKSHPETFTETKDGLVTEWEQVDELTWRFTIRDGVTFHNGEPFNAEVAAFNVLRSRDDATGATAPYFQRIDDAVAIDETTFEVTSVEPTPYLPSLMMLVQAIPPGYWEEVGPEEYGRAPVGTGPFVFDEWAEGQHIRMTRNEDYYKGAANVDSVAFTWAAEDSTRAALVQTGDADIVARLAPETAQSLEGTPGVQVHRVPALMKLLLFFNLDDPPLDDVRVRRAIAHAVDRDLLVEAVFGGDGAVPDPNVFHPMFSSAGGHGDAYIEHDPEAAQALLAEVGDIGPIDFHWPVGRYVNDGEVGEAISGMLEQVGFQVNRDPLEAGAFFDLLLTDEMTGMHLLGSVPTFGHEDGPLASYFKTSSVITYCADGSIDDLAEEALSLPAGAERDAVYNEIERILISELVCPVPLHIQVDHFATSDVVQGFVPRGDESWENLIDVSLSN